ncbi:MAG TPA: BLUF domain-containing protein [Ideonella sp.]|uniref:BLUF domain-containing protein n=1 Tax=Ideonella sp. TaxID=1929293 RepID=UPI002C71D10E|nr:BLUF domain-containing protein [Ideonella sp.]HSI52063.1 BLUF domain-containing protein [Ideonella sp.]
MLVRLMYASRATAEMDQEALTSILHQARSTNPAQGITGALCFAHGTFVQTLEGGRDAVNKLYHRIAVDPRHKQVVLLNYAEIAERHFAGWAMGMVNLTRLNPGLLLKYSETATLDPYTVSGAAMAALFDEMVATAAMMGQA